MINKDFRQLNSCRICEGHFDSKSLRLVDTPLANELYRTKSSSLEAEKFPLELVICVECHHVQLKHIVSPKRLFSNYVYRSGTSSFFRSHFSSLALEIAKRVPKASLVVEVGSNDGFLLGELDKNGLNSVGIEPSEQLASLARKMGNRTKTGYLSEEVVAEIVNEWGEAAVVIGNNVFAHIDDLLSSFKLVNKLLTNNGIFVFEVADFASLVKKGLFDTIYHEHMSYHTTKGLLKLAQLSGFGVEEVFEIEPHGGSLRFYLRKGGDSKVFGASVLNRVKTEEESGLDQASIFDSIDKTIKEKKLDLHKTLASLENQINLVGYGAPAKLVTFCYQMGIDSKALLYVIDDNELKQNSYIPGLGFLIVSQFQIQEILAKEWIEQRIAFLVFPWNLSSEILVKLCDWAPKGSSVITAFPNVQRSQLN